METDILGMRVSWLYLARWQFFLINGNQAILAHQARKKIAAKKKRHGKHTFELPSVVQLT
jgi:hypothetical protein